MNLFNSFSLIVLVSCITTGKIVEAQGSEVFIVTDYHCITNGSSALSIITPIERTDTSEKHNSDFVPSSSHDLQIDCRFERNEYCTTLWAVQEWKLQDSIQGDINHVVTDWRWEEFELHKTKNIDYDGGYLQFKQVLNFDKENFEIPISIRIKQDAHVFLCDGHITQSTCYWFMLQAFGGTTSVLRKCGPGPGGISTKYGVWPAPPCKDELDNKMHDNDDKILHEEFWSHLKIKKKDNVISITRNNEKILNYTDLRSFSPNTMFIHSKVVNGLWKIHKHTYIYCTEQTTTQVGPLLQIRTADTCVSMFIAMCPKCRLHFRLVEGRETIYSSSFSTKDDNWKEIKLLINSSEARNGVLYVTTMSEQDSGSFWAIGSVRQCKENEYRVSQSPNYRLPCQMVERDGNFNINNERVPESAVNCPETSFGTNCVPCGVLGGAGCTNFRKYCEPFIGGNTMTCFCSPGYHSGSNPYSCGNECPPGNYGHGCKRTCGHCSDGPCDKKTGNCFSGCQDQYTGNKCDIPPLGIFRDPPRVVRKDETSCTVEVPNFEITGQSLLPKYYKFQYREAVKETTWTDTDTVHHFNYVDEQIISKLEPDTEYHVRAVTYTDNDDSATGDAVKFSSCRTTCASFKPYNIDITPSNTSAKIDFKPFRYSCKIYNYEYSVDDSTKKRVDREQLEINDLLPCKQYRLSLSHVYTKETINDVFTTTEGVPSMVTALEATKASSSSIILKWQKPENENCNIIYYNIKYKVTRFRACTTQMKTPEVKTMQVYDAHATLSGLNPYSGYKIKVSAVTKGGEGKYADIVAETETADDFSADETLYIAQKKAYTDSATVILNTVDCTKARGPIYLRLELKCRNEWCNKENPVSGTNKYYELSPRVTVERLSPYVNYSLVLKVSRNSGDWTNARAITDDITTTTSVPNPIEDVKVVSKDEYSISLRWLPPFPPTGVLKQYQIRYATQGTFKTWKYQEDVEVTQCKLWPSYHCAKITKDIAKGWTYYLQIWAANESPGTLVQVNGTFPVTATSEAPDPPYGWSTNWTESNDLQITWKHPNSTNGLLKKFRIHVENDKRRKDYYLDVDAEDDYKLTYAYKVKEAKEPCSRYTFSITAYNEDYKSIPLTFNGWSPPPIPPIASNETLKTHSTNHTITVKFPPTKYDKGITSINKLYMFISSAENKGNVLNELVNFQKSLLNPQTAYVATRHSRIVLEAYQGYLPETFVIGSGNGTEFETKNIPNPPLELGREYCINLFYVNTCQGEVRLKWVNKTVYTKENPTEEEPITGSGGNKGLYALILLVFLIPLFWYAYMYTKKNRQTPSQALNVLKQPPGKKSDEIPLTDSHNKTKVNPVKPTVKPALQPKPKDVLQSVVSGDTPAVLQTTHSKRIKLFEYESYVKGSIQNGELERQHALFPRGQTKSWDYGALKVNKTKNRYNNLIAYDHSRVKLRKIAGIDYSDYINANYIDGYKVSRAYVATQGPKAATVNDFWRMIWQHNVKNIVMLANIYESGKKKVEKYWPDINEERDFDGVRVQYVSSDVFADYEYRVFNIYNNDQHRKVEQLHFTSWPDHGVPLYSQCLVPFLQKMLKIPNSAQSPVVVHCSAGVGRTGTIILCDICLRMAAAEGAVDFLAHLEHLRDQRANMVDNIEQYKLAHLVVLECLFGMHTSITCNDDMDLRIETLIRTGGIQNQMRYLEDTEWQDKAMDTVWSPEEEPPVYPEKNRVQDILPDLHHRVFLTRYPPEDETSSYINAVQVDGFRSPGRFVVTQQPMPNSVGDFWRLVGEKKSTVIISLNEVNVDDETCCRFWPESGEEMNPVDYLKVCHADTRLLDCYRIVTVHLINQKENENLSITIISMNNWMPRDLLPNSVEEFLSFWEDSDAISRQTDPVIITCYDGATASGLYIAMSFLIEKMKLEQECDVCLAVRTIRHNRRQFVTSEEQFEFLYRASVTYINGFQSYANFA